MAIPASEKIITKLRERRQIEADLRQMLGASSELEFRQQARQIAARGSQVLPAMVGRLDQADARMLKAIGTVITFLDRDEAATALIQVARQPERSDRGRLGAMTILSQYLDVPPDDSLLAQMGDPEAVAVASLREILTEAEENPIVLAEYAQHLDRQEPDLVLAVVQALRDSGDPRAVELLRIIAQDVRAEIAAATLPALSVFHAPNAARALQSVIPVLEPGLAPVAERFLRKLRFSGVEVEPLASPDSSWRALISPIDGLGQQSVWFIQDNPTKAFVRFLNVLLTDRYGAVQATGHERVSVLAVPPRQPPGYLHDVALPDGSRDLLMMEAPFDLGRRLVRDALAHNRETQVPVAAFLRLRGPWLWQHAGADALPARLLPSLTEGEEELVAESDQLLLHPGFSAWTLGSGALLEAAMASVRHPRRDLDRLARQLAAEIFSEPALVREFSQRLVSMSEWLLWSGDLLLSRQALAIARALGNPGCPAPPFVRALVVRDLRLAMLSLHPQEGQAGRMKTNKG